MAPALLIAVLVGTVVGAGRHAEPTARAPGRSAVPFGPFLALGGVIALLVGDQSSSTGT